MDWLFKVTIIWLSIDIVSIATIWYVGQTIPQLWPDWWTQNIVDSNDLNLGW